MRYIVDLSALSNKILSKFIEEGKISPGDEILILKKIHDKIFEDVRQKKEYAILAYEEINYLKEIASKKGISVKLVNVPKVTDINECIIKVAEKLGAVVITSDPLLAEKIKMMNLDVIFAKKAKKSFEDFVKEILKENVITAYIKEGTEVFVKKFTDKGIILEKLNLKFSKEDILSLIDEIRHKITREREWVIERDEENFFVVTSGDLRITIVQPPLSDSYEITIVRRVVQKSIFDYNLPERLIEKLKKGAEGILIAGPPGSGKSTFARALAKFFNSLGKVVKIVENPRGWALDKEITRIAAEKAKDKVKNIKDYLLLARPDYVLYDEVRSEEDFGLLIDLRLAGIGFIGVIHGSSPIDTLQRLINRVEVGTIPTIVDTLIFLERGEVKELYYLQMRVKVPSGFPPEKVDVMRPVVEVRDYLTDELKYEIYQFGQETTIVPVEKEKKILVERKVIKLEKEGSLEEILKKVKDLYFPSPTDIKRVSKIVRYIKEKYLDKHFENIVCGSIGLNTWTKEQGIPSIDFFLLFDRREKDIAAKTERVIASYSEDFYNLKTSLRGDRWEYEFVIEYEGEEITVHLIPVKKYDRYVEGMNSLDLQYIKYKYLMNKFREFPTARDSIRYLKLITKAAHAKGANSYIEGFSTFSLNIMAIYYKDFETLIKSIVEEFTPPLIIDLERKIKDISDLARHKFECRNPFLFIIDPVRPGIANDKLSTQTLARWYLRMALLYYYPSLYWFTYEPLQFLHIQEIAKLRGCGLSYRKVNIKTNPEKVVRGIKGRLEQIKKEANAQNIELYDYGVVLESEKLAFVYVMYSPRNVKREILGYPWSPGIISKIEKMVEREDVVYGPYINKDGKVCFDISKEVGTTKIKKIVEDLLNKYIIT